MAANIDIQELEQRLREAEEALRQAEQAIGRLKRDASGGSPVDQQTVQEPVEPAPQATAQAPPEPGTHDEAPAHAEVQQPPVTQQQPQGTSEQPASQQGEQTQQAAPQQPAQEQAQPEPAAQQDSAPQQDTQGKYRVEFDREGCIGAGACVAANADYWFIDDDGKATFKNSSFDKAKNMWVLYIEESDLQKHMDAAGVCPVNVIHVYDSEGNQKI